MSKHKRKLSTLFQFDKTITTLQLYVVLSESSRLIREKHYYYIPFHVGQRSDLVYQVLLKLQSMSLTQSNAIWTNPPKPRNCWNILRFLWLPSKWVDGVYEALFPYILDALFSCFDLEEEVQMSICNRMILEMSQRLKRHWQRVYD